ncbi:MAG: YicC family protein [Lentisphaeraceae bacterium]|nr:YicC family protein [Lentisphaeraceae bacterium]
MKSMTGFGRGEAADENYQISVDVTSVNRKQLDIRFSPPKEALFLDSVVRSTVPEFLARGSVNIQLKLNFSGKFSGVKFNDVAIAAYVDHIKELNKQHDLSSAISITEILQLPGTVDEADPKIDIDGVTAVAKKALAAALTHLVDSRSKEGLHLKEDLSSRQALMVELLAKLQESSKGNIDQFRDKLMSRIRDAGLELDLDSDRLYQEVVFHADRSDVTEELVRLEGHVKTFAELLKKTDPVGREMDFLMQEFNREVNTCASKSADSEIAKIVVAMKAEIERCREQVQNVE